MAGRRIGDVEAPSTLPLCAEMMVLDRAESIDGHPTLHQNVGQGSGHRVRQGLEGQVAILLQLAPEQNERLEPVVVRGSDDPTESSPHLQGSSFPSNSLLRKSRAIRWFLLLAQHVHVEDSLHAKVRTTSVPCAMILTHRAVVETHFPHCVSVPKSTTSIEWRVVEGRLSGHVLWLCCIANGDEQAIWVASFGSWHLTIRCSICIICTMGIHCLGDVVSIGDVDGPSHYARPIQHRVSIIQATHCRVDVAFFFWIE